MTPDIVEFVEKQLGVQLLEPQKDFLRKTQNEKPIYLVIPRHIGYDHFCYLALIAQAILDDTRKENL